MTAARAKSSLTIAQQFLEVVLPTLKEGEVYRGEAWPSPDPFADNFLNSRFLAKYLVTNGQMSNAYFCVFKFKSAGKGRKATAACGAAVVWADLDCGPGKPFASRAEAIARVSTFPLKPRYIISSGRGIHVYWLLNELVDAEGLNSFMAIVRGIASRLDGDPQACKRTQLMRVPGTMNLDSVTKKKDGRDYPVEIIEDNVDAPSYSLDDFEDAGVVPFPEAVQEEQARGNEDYPASDAERSASKCGWMAHCRDEARPFPRTSGTPCSASSGVVPTVSSSPTNGARHTPSTIRARRAPSSHTHCQTLDLVLAPTSS